MYTFILMVTCHGALIRNDNPKNWGKQQAFVLVWTKRSNCGKATENFVGIRIM